VAVVVQRRALHPTGSEDVVVPLDPLYPAKHFRHGWRNRDARHRTRVGIARLRAIEIDPGGVEVDIIPGDGGRERCVKAGGEGRTMKKRKPKGYTLDAKKPASFVIATTRLHRDHGLAPSDDTASKRAAALQRIEHQRERSQSTKLRKRDDKLAAVRTFKNALPPHVNAPRAIADAFHVNLSTAYRWLDLLGS
jgi:hypothetical protein